MKRTMICGVTLMASLALVMGCKKKDENKNKPKPAAKKPVGQPGTKTPTAKKKVVGEDLIKHMEACWKTVDTKDKAGLSKCYGDGTVTFVDAIPPMTAKGGEAAVKMMSPMLDAIDPMKHELSLVLVNGTNMAVVALATGTQKAPLMGKEGTKSFGMWTAQLARFNDTGDLQDSKHWTDMGTMMAQLGHMPNPQAAPVETKAWETPLRIVAKNDDTEKANLAWLKSISDSGKEISGEKALAEAGKKMLAMYAPDAEFRYVAAPKGAKGTKELEANMKQWTGMHSKMKMTTKSAWAAGDWIVTETEISATMAQDMGPMKVKGKSYTAHYLEVLQIKDKKVTKHLIFANHGKMMADLGVMPPQGDAPKGAAPAKKDAPPAKKDAPPAK